MMTKTNRFLTAILFLFAAGFGSVMAQEEDTWPKEGTVIAEKLTIRAKPGTHFESLGFFTRGDKVVAIGKYENWLEVKLPDSVLCWVTSEAVDEKGVVLMDSCPLYSGPAVVFTSFGKVKRGTKLSLVENASVNWRQARVPEGTTAWVSAQYIMIGKTAPAIEAAPAKDEPMTAQDIARAAEAKARDDEVKAVEAKVVAEARADAAEKAAQEAEIKRKVAEEKRLAEEKRIADEKAKAEEAAKRAEEAQKAAQEAEAKRLAEEKRIADEKAKAEEAAKRAEEAQKAAEEAEEKRLAE
ncbi:MAG: hypothetical protein J5833_06350, partial [Victivallales bacterium]|nr:hypothetical protein [Victivallales bacterium]